MSNGEVVNSMAYEAKPLMMDVIRTERKNFFDLAENPANWNVQTRCTEWDTRDIVYHIIDTTEGYLMRWDKARKGEMPEVLNPFVFAEEADKGAKALRHLSQDEAIARLKAASKKMMETFEAVTEDEWNNFLVAHRYFGPIPTFLYFSFQVMDYGVHTWDIRYGLGDKTAKIDERTAGVLIPYMLHVLMAGTVDAKSAEGLDTVFGIEISGPWGGKWRATVKDGKFEAKPEEDNFEGCEAIFSYDPSDFVLTAFQRFPGGAARGDPEVIEKVRNLFFRI